MLNSGVCTLSRRRGDFSTCLVNDFLKQRFLKLLPNMQHLFSCHIYVINPEVLPAAKRASCSPSVRSEYELKSDSRAAGVSMGLHHPFHSIRWATLPCAMAVGFVTWSFTTWEIPARQTLEGKLQHNLKIACFQRVHFSIHPHCPHINRNQELELNVTLTVQGGSR